MSLTHTTSDIDVLTTLDPVLRALVQRDGVDPQQEPGVVRRLAHRLVQEHDQRSLTGAVVPVADQDRLVDDLVANVAGFGPLQRYLDDPEVEELWINDPARVFVARGGRHELTPVILDRAQVADLVERMLKLSGRRVDLSQPFVDALLPGGHRLHVVLEGISRGFSAVKTAVKKTTARLASHGTAARSSSSPGNLCANQPRPHRSGTRRAAAG